MDISALKKEFEKLYGASQHKSYIFFAPGRVNLIGEHTDYNGGYVFPCALNFGTYLVVRKRDDKLLKLASVNINYKSVIDISDINKKQDDKWVNYPLGVLNEFLKLGIKLTGLEMLFYGNVPNGAGLSSSASIEIATAVAINELFDAGLNGVEIAKLGQRAENEFVGVNCGIMDQFASAMGKANSAIFLDCITLDFKLVPLKLKGYKLIVSNTNKRRGLADSKYNERRAECEKAVEFIRPYKPISFLGEIDLEEFKILEPKIANETIRRRARHVVTEIDRTKRAVEELNTGNIEKFGQLMNGSHDSLRDDYEVTGYELDTLVEEARKIPGVLGSRMTGAGFGGCTVSLVPENEINNFINNVGENYNKKTGLKADFYIAEIGNGAGRIEIF